MRCLRRLRPHTDDDAPPAKRPRIEVTPLDPSTSDSGLPSTVVVSENGSKEQFTLKAAAIFRQEYKVRTGIDLRPWHSGPGSGRWVYISSCGTRYLWSQNVGTWLQWKFAVAGEGRSRYSSYFPFGVRRWKSMIGECSPADFFVTPKGGKQGTPSNACGTAGTGFTFLEPHKEDPVELPMLGVEEAERFYEDGYIVLRADSLGSHARASRALREMNLVLAELAIAGLETGRISPEFGLVEDLPREGLNSVRVQSRKEFTALLSPLRTIIQQLLGGCPEEPETIQLAYAPPTGSMGEGFEGRSDCRAGDEYHIDGRGRIPNGFALLVGVALSSPPPGSCAWGALTVFPGSHRNASLHREYPKKKAESGQHMDLGTPRHVTLERGDAVLAHSLLAHRRSENWSDAWRYQIYWRLKPERARSDHGWESGMPGDPWAVLPGVLAARRGRVNLLP